LSIFICFEFGSLYRSVLTIFHRFSTDYRYRSSLINAGCITGNVILVCRCQSTRRAPAELRLFFGRRSSRVYSRQASQRQGLFCAACQGCRFGARHGGIETVRAASGFLLLLRTVIRTVASSDRHGLSSNVSTGIVFVYLSVL